MKVVVLHKDFNDCLSSLRYFIESGKGVKRKIVFYDYIYFSSTERIQKNRFQLFHWEVEALKQHFSIYN